MDRQLSDILTSGEIVSINLNGNALGHDLLTRDEINTLITTSGASVGLVKQGNGYCLEINTTPQTGNAAVNLMASGDAVQDGIVYVKGVKYSALTQFQIDALPNLEAGTCVYNTTSKALQLYIGSKWVDLYAGDILKDYRYRTADTAPATGEVTLNNTDLTAATLLRVHHTDADGDDVSGVLIAVQVGSVVELEGNQQKAVYNVTAINDQTNHTEYTVTWASGDVTTPFTDGQKVLFDIPDSAGGGVSKFTELDDVPGSYVGESGKVVSVKATEDGVEFIDISPPAGSANAHIYGAEGKNRIILGLDTNGGLKEAQSWDNTLAYNAGDVVVHKNSLWLSVIGALAGEEPGVAPATSWNLYIGGEGRLGNPTTDGDILSSTAAGVRSWVGPPSGLEKVTEAGKSGWRLIGAAQSRYYGDIGNKAVDISSEGTGIGHSGYGALGDFSVAQNQLTKASGQGSHAEGYNTEASGDFSHAEGRYTEASGSYSHSGGRGASPTFQVLASGESSFNHQQAIGATAEAAANNSVILGGRNNATTAPAVRSVVLGGSNQSATQPNMVYMMGMRLTPQTQAQIDAMTPEEGTHVWNSTLQAEQVYDGNEWRIEEMTNRLTEFKFETATTTPPGVGMIRTNNANPALATKIFVSEQNDHNHDISAYMNKLVPGNRLTILGADQFVSYTITTLIKTGAYYDIGVTVIDSELATPFANNHPVLLQGIAPATTEPSGLEKVTEAGQTGWRLIGKDPAKFGNIGARAVDFSTSSLSSSVNGATGVDSFAMGFNARSNNNSSFAFGNTAKAAANGAIALGSNVSSTGANSFTTNTRTQSSGADSFTGGHGNSATELNKATGVTSFNFQETTASAGTHKEAAANQSAILGGQNNTTTAAALRSVVLGGSGQVATVADTLYYPKGKMQGQAADPTGLTAADEGMMWWNSTSHELKVWDGTAIKTVTVT